MNSLLTRSTVRLQAALAELPVVPALALRLRNQCQMILERYWSPPDDAELNGEAQLVRALGPGLRRFFDVGANRGDWTELLLAHAPPEVAGVLFEPGSEAARLLRERFRDRPSIQVREAAVSDHTGRDRFFEEVGAGKRSSLIEGFPQAEVHPKEVEVTTVDAALEELGWPQLDFLKIDIEGMDLFGLRGARGVLVRQAVGAVQFEYNRPWRDVKATLADAYRLLEESGYSVFLLRRNGLHRLDPRRTGEFYTRANFVALGAAAMQRCRSLLR